MTGIEQNQAQPRRTSHRRRHSRRQPETGAQIALGWAALAIVLVSALHNGGLPSVAWTLLSLATLALFSFQAWLDLRYGLPGPARKALLVALPWGLVLAWLLVQSQAGRAPGLVHPLWAFAPEGAEPTISAKPDAGRQVVMRLTCYAMLFWIFLRSAGAAKHGGFAFIQAIAVFSTALAVYGMVAKATGTNFLLGTDESVYPLRASFFYRNAYATFAVFGVLANITAYVRIVGGGAERAAALRDFLEAFFSGGWIFAFGTLLGLAAITMTLSRGGAMVAVVGVVVLAWALRRGAGKVSLISLAIPAVLFTFVALFMTSGTIDRLNLIDREERFGVYPRVVAGIGDRPLLGHGAGAFKEVFRGYMVPENAEFNRQYAHSTYLENAFEFGLPAAALYYVALAIVGWRLLLGVLTKRRNQSISAFALACWAAAGFHAGFDFTLQFPAIAALFAAILGIGWAQSFPTRRPGKGAERRPRVDDL